MPWGNSGDPASPNFDNTQADWLAGEYRPMPYDRDEVDAATVEAYTIQP